MTCEGFTAPGWSVVEEAFGRTVQDDEGAGAALCVYVDGRPVVDLWGGDVDQTGRAWQQRTSACVFSATKGVAALCVHRLVQEDLLDLEAPVADYWPNFASAGKEHLKVRWILSHQAGLLGVDADLTLGDVEAQQPVLRALEQQPPLWPPGTHHGYHAVTFGFLVGELIRRVTGLSLGRYFHEKIAVPLNLRAWIGLPIEDPVDLAVLDTAPVDGPDLADLVASDPTGPFAQFARVLTLSGAFPLTLNAPVGGFNDRRVLAIELPAAGMVTDARSLARVYAAAVSEVDGVRLLSDETAAACSPLQTSQTSVFGSPSDAPRTLDFSLGFLYRPLLGRSSFGHPGASGSLGFADLEHRVGFGYVPRLMRPEGADARVPLLLDAVRQALG